MSRPLDHRGRERKEISVAMLPSKQLCRLSIKGVLSPIDYPFRVYSLVLVFEHGEINDLETSFYKYRICTEL